MQLVPAHVNQLHAGVIWRPLSSACMTCLSLAGPALLWIQDWNSHRHPVDICLGQLEETPLGPLMGKISPFVIKLLRSSRKPNTNGLSSGQLQTILPCCFSLPPCFTPPLPPYHCSLESFPNKVPLCMCLLWAPFSEKYKLTYFVYFVLDWIKLYEIVNIWPFLTYKNGYFILSNDWWYLGLLQQNARFLRSEAVSHSFLFPSINHCRQYIKIEWVYVVIDLLIIGKEKVQGRILL